MNADMTANANEGNIYLANVGANASHGFAGPVFSDGRFEFLPIPETPPDLPGPFAVRYGHLRSFYDPAQSLAAYFPERVAGLATHNDPEFETFTYGDNCEANARAAGLRSVGPGDNLFFLVRLAEWDESGPTGRHGFYLIGFLRIAGVLKGVRSRPSDGIVRAFGNNAHLRRGFTDPNLWDGFWVFKGGDGSRRFPRAVPVDRALCQQVFRKANGAPWTWASDRSDLPVIGSYTRACRRVIDPSTLDGAERAQALWEHVAKHSGPETLRDGWIVKGEK